MKLHKVMQHGFLTNMDQGVCAWEDLDFAQMQRGISAHMHCGGKLLSRVMNMLPCSLEMHTTMVGYVNNSERISLFNKKK